MDDAEIRMWAFDTASRVDGLRFMGVSAIEEEANKLVRWVKTGSTDDAATDGAQADG